MSAEHISADEAAALADHVAWCDWVEVAGPEWCPTCNLPSGIMLRRVVYRVNERCFTHRLDWCVSEPQVIGEYLYCTGHQDFYEVYR